MGDQTRCAAYVFLGIDVPDVAKIDARPLCHILALLSRTVVAIITRNNHLVVTDSGCVVLGLAVDVIPTSLGISLGLVGTTRGRCPVRRTGIKTWNLRF